MGSNNISNNLYQGWNCLIVIFPIVAALLTGIWFLIKRGHEKTNEFIIGIKEEVHTVFMNTIINEARRLIQIVDEHLPHALSQDRSEEPFPSRFDYFCTSLRQIPEAQLDRFLLHIKIDYPQAEHEKLILQLARDEAMQTSPSVKKSHQAISQESLFTARQEVLNTYMADNLQDY